MLRMWWVSVLSVFLLLPGKNGTNFRVKLNTTTRHVTSTRFLSYTLDTYLMGQDVRWGSFNFTDERLVTLVRALGPAYLRVGGTPADFLFFNKPYDVINATGLTPAVVIMTRKDWDGLVRFSERVSARLLFEFNLQTRYGTQWDPSNAMDLLEYSQSRGYGHNIDFQLGNEPGFYGVLNADQVRLSGSQIARDYHTLRRLTGKYPCFNGSSVVGPDTMYGDFILKEFIDGAGDIIKAATIHHYYFSGHGATYEDYINPFYFDNFVATVYLAKTIIARSKYPRVALWVGEGADAMDSGTPNVSDRFVSGFLWLEKLGMAARLGVEVVMRQDLYGHFYGLLDNRLDPNPDFWLSWLYNNLVGAKVLTAEFHKPVNDVRVYAHCTNSRHWKFPPGSVTLIVINVNQYESADIDLGESYQNGSKYLYLLEPHGPDRLLSRRVSLNGVLLQTTGRHGDIFPKVKPRIIQEKSAIIFPALTFGFIVLP